MPTAFFDANVLFGARLRSLVIEAARGRMFRARWSRRVHDEWIAAVRRRRRDLTGERLEAIVAQMDAAVPDAEVTGYDWLIAGLTLPDEDDRHVLAAAIVGRADVIVTFNLDDFPASALDRFGLSARHPDAFLLGRDDADPGSLAEAAASDRAHYRDPPLSADRYLADLARAGLPGVASRLGAPGTGPS